MGCRFIFDPNKKTKPKFDTNLNIILILFTVYSIISKSDFKIILILLIAKLVSNKDLFIYYISKNSESNVKLFWIRYKLIG